jgi:protease I
MTTSPHIRKAAFLVAPEGAEQVELTQPWKAVTEAGAEATLVSTAPGKIQAFNLLDRVVDDVSADEFDMLVPPLLSSRRPDDLPAFCDGLVKELSGNR